MQSDRVAEGTGGYSSKELLPPVEPHPDTPPYSIELVPTCTIDQTDSTDW
jgi:hypothetical protein